jgi:hypothetical protein
MSFGWARRRYANSAVSSREISHSGVWQLGGYSAGRNDQGSNLDNARFLLLHTIQTGSGAHLACIQYVPENLSPGVKRQEREAAHSPSSSAEVKKDGAIPPLPFTSSWRNA